MEEIAQEPEVKRPRRITRKEWYRRVNETWPDIVPALTFEEGARAARRLFRFVTGRKFEGKVIETSGRRYSGRVEYRFIFVNPERGWKELIHTMSHYLLPIGHGGEHARLERRMIKEVIRRGWLEGRLKSEPKPGPTKDELRAAKIERAQAALVRWERKLARAQRALAKARRKLRKFEGKS